MVIRDDTVQVAVHSVGVHVAQTKDHDAGQPGSTGGYQFTEVQVVCQENPARLQDCCILQPFKTMIVQMRSIVSKTLQESHSLGRDTHICQEFHTADGSNEWTFSSASQAAYWSAC